MSDKTEKQVKGREIRALTKSKIRLWELQSEFGEKPNPSVVLGSTDGIIGYSKRRKYTYNPLFHDLENVKEYVKQNGPQAVIMSIEEIFKLLSVDRL